MMLCSPTCGVRRTLRPSAVTRTGASGEGGAVGGREDISRVVAGKALAVSVFFPGIETSAVAEPVPPPLANGPRWSTSPFIDSAVQRRRAQCFCSRISYSQRRYRSTRARGSLSLETYEWQPFAGKPRHEQQRGARRC